MRKEKIYLVIFFWFLYFGLQAQNKQVTRQSLYWIRYYNQLTINTKWTWHNELEERRFFENNQHHHFIAHSRMHYKILQNADLAFGMTYSRQSPQDPHSISHLVVPEIRPAQEITYINSISKRLALQHRIRIDERFIRKNDGEVLLPGYNFNFRFRYRLLASFKLNRDSTKRATTLKLANEIMLNAGRNIIYNQFDQNRIYAGIEQVLNKNFSMELGYMYWYQQRPTQYQFFDRDIIRLTIYHRIKL